MPSLDCQGYTMHNLVTSPSTVVRQASRQVEEQKSCYKIHNIGASVSIFLLLTLNSTLRLFICEGIF